MKLFEGVEEDRCPFEKVAILKECMHEGARVLRKQIAQQHADQPHVRAHYLVRLWRDLRARQWHRIAGWAAEAGFIK